MPAAFSFAASCRPSQAWLLPLSSRPAPANAAPQVLGLVADNGFPDPARLRRFPNAAPSSAASACRKRARRRSPARTIRLPPAPA